MMKSGGQGGGVHSSVSFKCCIQGVRGNHSVLMFTDICGSGVRSKTIGMGDNESDDKEVVNGDSEWTFIIGDSVSGDMGMLVEVSGHVVVVIETGVEGVSRPDGSSAGSVHSV